MQTQHSISLPFYKWCLCHTVIISDTHTRPVQLPDCQQIRRESARYLATLPLVLLQKKKLMFSPSKYILCLLTPNKKQCTNHLFYMLHTYCTCPTYKTLSTHDKNLNKGYWKTYCISSGLICMYKYFLCNFCTFLGQLQYNTLVVFMQTMVYLFYTVNYIILKNVNYRHSLSVYKYSAKLKKHKNIYIKKY